MRNALGARLHRRTRPAPHGTCRGRARAWGAAGGVLIILAAGAALAGGPRAESAAGGGAAAPPAPAPAARDTLASYIEHHLFLLQDDGMLAPKLVGALTTVPEATSSVAAVRGAMRAPLLNTYERIGFASGILTDRIPGYRSLVTIEWGGARAEFDVAQTVQWVEPPAQGATELELPGRKPAAGSGH